MVLGMFDIPRALLYMAPLEQQKTGQKEEENTGKFGKSSGEDYLKKLGKSSESALYYLSNVGFIAVLKIKNNRCGYGYNLIKWLTINHLAIIT